MADILSFTDPSTVGVPSRAVLAFLDNVEKRGVLLHSFLMARHGKVFAEGYWSPFRPGDLHRMYSISKTFVSAAIGLLVGDGRLSLDEKIASFFPELLPANPDPYILETTVRDLLRMATPYSCGATYCSPKDGRPCTEWLRSFFDPPHPADHPPGTLFLYDTSGTFVLDCIVERLTGKPFLEFLKDRMLRDIGFSENAWCVKAPDGYSWGGSGVECTTRDLARFALVFLQGGCAGGRRYLSADYVRAATSRQIDNALDGHRDPMYGHGYGYQIWVTQDGSFSFYGMGGQLAVCIPKHDFLFVCTGDTQGGRHDTAPMYEALWSTVLPHLDEIPDPNEEDALARLRQRLSGLTCVIPLLGAADSPALSQWNGRSWTLRPNSMGIHRISLSFENRRGTFRYLTDRGEKELPFGLGEYVLATFPETHYFGRTIGTPKGTGYRCMTAGVFTEPEKLVLRTYLIDDYFGNLAITLSFKGKEIAVGMIKTAEWFLDEYQGIAGGSLDPV